MIKRLFRRVYHVRPKGDAWDVRGPETGLIAFFIDWWRFGLRQAWENLRGPTLTGLKGSWNE